MKEKKYIQEKRNELIWDLHKQGYEVKDIRKIVGGNLDRTWIYRIIKKMPVGWILRCSKPGQSS